MEITYSSKRINIGNATVIFGPKWQMTIYDEEDLKKHQTKINMKRRIILLN